MQTKTKKTPAQRRASGVGSGRMVRGLLYMHTIEGKPAYYVPGDQIVSATRHYRWPVKLCTSMKQIREEERASIKKRREWGFQDTPHYGHVYVSSPNNPVSNAAGTTPCQPPT